jgi:hypothetical protein
MRNTLAFALAFFLLFSLTVHAQTPTPTTPKPPTPDSFVPKDLKDWVITVGTGVTIIGVLLTSWIALAEWHQATKQRKIEYRHKQAVYAREITKEIFNDPKARAALQMLDWSRKSYKSDEGESLIIRRNAVQSALRAPQPNSQVHTRLKFSKDEAFIRTRFEALYDRFEELERLIQLDIVNFEDIQTAFRYYVVRIQRDDVQHVDFLVYYDYPNVQKLLSRFEEDFKPRPLTSHPPEWLSPSELEDDELAPTESR